MRINYHFLEEMTKALESVASAGTNSLGSQGTSIRCARLSGRLHLLGDLLRAQGRLTSHGQHFVVVSRGLETPAANGGGVGRFFHDGPKLTEIGKVSPAVGTIHGQRVDWRTALALVSATTLDILSAGATTDAAASHRSAFVPGRAFALLSARCIRPLCLRDSGIRQCAVFFSTVGSIELVTEKTLPTLRT